MVSDDWLSEKHRLIFSSPNDATVVGIVRHAGLNPSTFFSGGDFASSDFGSEDVTGWDFRGTDLRRANLQTLKNLDKAQFDISTRLEGALLPEGLTVEMLVAIQE